MARNVEVEYPNRDKPSSRAMRLVVVAVLLVSSALIAYVTVTGWDLMESARTMNVLFVAVNLVFVVQVLRWSRGVLPMAAGVATFVAIFSGVAIPSWYERDAPGYADAALSADLGLLTTVVFVVQLVVMAAAIGAFAQNWQTEVERPSADPRRGDRAPHGAVPA